MQSDSLLIYLLLIPTLLAPVPFIFAYLKIIFHSKKNDVSLLGVNDNLCTLAEKFSLQKYIIYGFYLTGILSFGAGLLFSLFVGGSLSNVLLIIWMIIGILFFLSGKSVFDHSGKTHNISSRLLILFLIAGSVMVSFQLIQENFIYGLVLSFIIIISGIYITYRTIKLKFIDRIAQMSFHLGFTMWNWLVCGYIITSHIL